MLPRLLAVVLSLVLVGASQPAVAQVPALFQHEGMLLDADGLPLQGSVGLRFAIYAAPVGGLALWSEEYQLDLVDGYYSVLLGSQDDLVGLFGQGDRYLGVALNGAAELSPRHRLVSVPHSLVADNALGDITPNSVWVGGQQVIDETGNWVGPPVPGAGDGVGYDTPEAVIGALRTVDGAGSLLDADRLDGLDSTAFVQGAAQVRDLLTTVDGAGSGVDADRLDGLDSTVFLRDGAQVLAALAPADGTGSGLDADRLDGLDSTEFFVPGALGAPAVVLGLLVGVDGAGSGLDADRLDGLEASRFLRTDQDTGTTGTLSAAHVEVRGAEMGGTRRAWMADGVAVGGGGSDGAYFGMKEEGPNAADAVVAWGDDAGDDLRFIFARSGGALDGEEYLRVTSAGAVGVATPTPLARLDVNGDLRAHSLKLVPQADPPANPSAGTLYLSSVTGSLHLYDGAAWNEVSGPVAGVRPRVAWGSWVDLNDGQDAVRALPYPVFYTKQENASLLRLTLSANLRTNGAAGECCRWALRVNGENCGPLPVNGNVYISPGGNYHQHRTITGICPGIAAGPIVVEPWLEQCPGYGIDDCYTGWLSTTSIIVEELPQDGRVAYGAWDSINRQEDATNPLPISVTYTKQDPASWLDLSFTSVLRTSGVAGACCRWNLRVNGASCEVPVNGNVYINPAGDYHQIRTIRGICPNIPAGQVVVQPWVEQCPGYGNYDCYTGWQSTTSLIVQERPAGQRMAYTGSTSLNDGGDPNTAVPFTVRYTKQQDDSPLRLTFSSNLRTNGAAGTCCRWDLRVNARPCRTPVNGSVYINPAGNYHQHRTITGICEDVPAGQIEVRPFVENCPGYSGPDCVTGWNSSSFLIVEEGPFN